MKPTGTRAMLTCLFAAAALTSAGLAAGTTIDLTPSKDNTLIETPVGNSNGAGDGIYAGRVGPIGGGTRRRGVLAFDLSSIPAGATINAVTLKLEMAQSPDAAARTVSLYRATADWGEAGSLGSGSGAPAASGDATWSFRVFNTQSWTTAGGDFTGVASASQAVADIGTYSWTGAGLVADVQGWLNSAATNFGWLVMGDESASSTVKKFYSREGLTPPDLTVDYTDRTDVAPGTDAGRVAFAAPWPSPASGRVNLSYALPRAARVSLSIHDPAGRIVRRLAIGDSEISGRHAMVWDGRTETGAQAAPGIYLANLVVDAKGYQRRIALLR